MAHFYLTLPSNSSAKYYPDNTMTRFTTRLEKSVSLTGDWEVGLVEIQYTRSWNNLFRGEGRVQYMQSAVLRGKQIFVQHQIRLPPGYYESPSDIVQYVNQHIEEFAKKSDIEQFPIFNYNAFTKRLHGVISNGASVIFSQALCFMLGIGARQNPIQHFDDEPLTFRSNHACDMNRDLNSLFVYCNLLEHVLVGDSKVPLLRIVPISGKHGDNSYITYEKPQYVPIQRKHFDSIEIDIRNDAGLPIPFETGKVLITLHFRLRKIPYLLQ